MTTATATATATATGPSVSVVLPAHRTGPDLDRCLAALDALSPRPAEVLVVVDGADPAVVAAARPHASEVLPLAVRGGPARARNAGAAHAGGDLLFFVDADVELPPRAVAQVQQRFEERPELSALIGSYDDEPGAPNFLSQYKNLLNHHVHQTARTEGFTFWGACGAVRRQVFAEAGGFDESYARPSVEDIELGYRLRAAGHRIEVLKDLQVKHLKRWGARSLLSADVRDRALPWSELILRSGRLDDDLNIDVAARAKVATTAVLLVLDAPLLRFYARVRGPRFALAAVPWTWFSHAYSGAAFALALARRATAGRGPGGGRA